MNKKGFTLIELLATITILALILMVAVPNVMSTIDKNKKNAYVEDAKKMITLAEYELRSNSSIETPKPGYCVVFLMNSLDLTDISEGPEGGNYNLTQSYVVISNKSGTYEYAATLVEEYDGAKRGLPLTTREKLTQEGAMRYVVKDEELMITTPTVGSSLNGTIVSNIVKE